MARRWLIYAPNGFGLGHVVRQLALARQLRRRDPDGEFLFLTECEASNLIWREGFASVKMIAFHTVQRGLFSDSRARLINRTTVATTFAAFQPDVFIADAMPLGRDGELAGILPCDVPSVLVCREKSPKVRARRSFWQDLSKYDLVLLPHREGEVEFKAPPKVDVAWSDYFLIRAREEVLSRDEARRRARPRPRPG